ncbi:MAG: serine/threonine-protein kinase [Candidatus Zixiibacteriota bacterium]
MDESTRPLFLLETGVKVGHYVIERKLGSGGMGVVYLAHDVELDRKVALKFLAPHLNQSSEYKYRFKVEAQAAARLHHRNIVTVFDVAEFRDTPYIVMEYVEGRSLKEEIQIRQFTLDEVLEIGRQLCDALSEAHGKGVVHRDIKPGNIIIDQSNTVRVLDFGLAKFMQPQKDHLSQSGALIGTVCYMSPEQIRGETIDQRSDIFALGTVIYEMLYGKPPFGGESDIAVAHAILSKHPEFAASSHNNVPTAVIEVLSRALQKKPERRFQNAAEMSASLTGRGETKSNPFKISGRAKPVSKVIVAAAITFLVAGYFAINWRGDGRQTPMMSTVIAAESSTDTIVVLPFRNLTGDSENDYVAFTITRGVSSRFKYGTSLAVRDEGRFDGILSMKNRSQVPDTVNARYVISGELRRATNGFAIGCRITVRGAATSQINDETALSSVNELTEAQGRLFESLLRKLGFDDGQISNDPFVRESLQHETRVLIQKGLYLLTIDQAETALELFKRAKEREPDRFIIDYYLGLANEGLSRYNLAIGHYKLALAEASQEQAWRTLYECGDSTSLSFPSSYGLDTAWITGYLPTGGREIAAMKISEMKRIWKLRLAGC